MEDALRLLEDLQESIDSFERRPADKFEAKASFESNNDDCTCGVCGNAYAFSDTHIVDGDKFEYSQWDTERIDHKDAETDQDRLCWKCAGEFLRNGGRFDKWRYEGYTKCPRCYGEGECLNDSEDGTIPCPDCDGDGYHNSQ